MTDTLLTATVRTETGKGAARKLRRQGLIPATFYGPGAASVSLSVDSAELRKALKEGGGENAIIGLRMMAGNETSTKNVMLKELQVDTLKDTYLHADFYEIAMDKEITLDVAIRLINTPKGVTDGGMLQHVRRDITVSCLPGKVVEYISVDVSELDMGETLHIADITLPEGMRTELDGTLSVATVLAPKVTDETEEAPGEEEGEGAPEK